MGTLLILFLIFGIYLFSIKYKKFYKHLGIIATVFAVTGPPLLITAYFWQAPKLQLRIGHPRTKALLNRVKPRQCLYTIPLTFEATTGNALIEAIFVASLDKMFPVNLKDGTVRQLFFGQGFAAIKLSAELIYQLSPKKMYGTEVSFQGTDCETVKKFQVSVDSTIDGQELGFFTVLQPLFQYRMSQEIEVYFGIGPSESALDRAIPLHLKYF